MNKIYKADLRMDEGVWSFLANGKFIRPYRLNDQHGQLDLWYEVELDRNVNDEVVYEIVFTGGNNVPTDKRYFKTHEIGNMVYHVFLEDWKAAPTKDSGFTALMDGLANLAPMVKVEEVREELLDVYEEDHGAWSFLYEKQDGSRRVVRLTAHMTFGHNNGRQFINAWDLEANGLRTFYLDQIIVNARIV